MPKTKLQRYTVIGYYADNMQPFVAQTKAASPGEAAKRGAKQATADGLRVVEVIEGWHKGCLGNDAVL